MEFTYILTFVGGFAADLARRVLLPQTEEWIEGKLPYKRRSRNRDKNLLQLEVREKLVKLGHDPALASHIEDDGDAFLKRLEIGQRAKRDAFAEFEADRLASQAQSQAEMNQVAFDRFELADRALQTTVERFSEEVWLSEEGRTALENAQKAWMEFREADANLEGLATAEGGSMLPLVHASAMEALTLDRVARLNALREELRDR